ncbi:DNA polymerase IV [Clostridium chauvoei]|uniref:DNA polymerase IV n=2 Tax=Clostridium chauvoei TaxID=46867 RepID=A0A1U6J5T3_9CLOT|nr:DNA polymerase IV [Clostridium chauvoei]ATD54672.1 DNA polymerase IV [Clostridium chauvoei]ATD57646.1 DNA polymerase IV [Clostridium chauvoei]MBX7279968.1 DNA polymerase IV [Clostridium chauvoei]MBX7282373.1 DNA polymerase IV [Clostridium chauvoei]MBX7284859.1 DNA polymerase IV [Clostridium chauvoei]
MDKIILHVDMDAFFASVEQMDNPNLKGKPVIVGGVSERGVVSTCSYEARRYGVHSAMPIFMAQKLCPHGIYLKSRYYRYKEISKKIFEIFKEVTCLVEPLSIDEAYLDITESRFKSGLEAANYIKKRVYKEVGLNLSIGISYNKFLAKIASDWNKPNGIMVITKEMIPEILLPLKISKIYGLGSKSVKKLNNMGFFRIVDLYEMPIEFYTEYLGKNGFDIYYRIRGIDNREVVINRDRKSYGKEVTLKNNTNNKEELLLYLKEFSLYISKELKIKGIKGKTVTIKYKTSNFESHTRSRTLNYYTNRFEDFYKISKEVLKKEDFADGVRLIGLTISSFRENFEEQLSIF